MVENESKQALLQLGRDILGDCNKNASDDDVVAYQHRARKIDLLISVSTAMRMVGYYLRACLYRTESLQCRTEQPQQSTSDTST